MWRALEAVLLRGRLALVRRALLEGRLEAEAALAVHDSLRAEVVRAWLEDAPEGARAACSVAAWQVAAWAWACSEVVLAAFEACVLLVRREL